MKNLKNLLRYNKLSITIIVLVSIYCFIFTKIIKYESKYSINDNTLIGTVSDLNINGNKVTMHVLGKEEVIAYFYLREESDVNKVLNTIHLGDKLTLNGKFIEPNNNTIPNTFNYKKYLNSKKIFYTFEVEEYDVKNQFKPFYKLKDLLLKSIYEKDNKDYYLVFLLGDKTLLDGNIYSSFQTNGISHLLAVSGMHIGIILLFLNFILKRFKKIKQNIISSFILLMFAFLTGFSASVLRAVIFYIINNLNKYLNLHLNSLELLLITASIILIINPFMIYDLGFIYSFVVCFGIVYYNDKLKGNYIISLLKLSFITFLFSLPITAYLNYEINILSPLINLIFVPFVTFIIYPLSIISFIFPIFDCLFNFLINIFNSLNLIFSSFAININIPKISFVYIMLFYLILLISKNNFKKMIFLLFIILFVKVKVLFDSNYYVYFLDVGQGDSSVLISPYKKEVIMIDTGGKIEYKKDNWMKSSKIYNISDNVIKFLKSIGITKIDYLILSHGDADHAGEAINIIKKLNVKNVVLNEGDLNNLEKSIKKLSNVAVDYDLKYFNIKNLNNKNYNDENENSIINSVKFLSYHLLFMGDASVKQEEYLIKKNNIKNIDILKVGHHGSKTSSSKTFINAINPKYSIISVGKNNKFGHPNKEVVKTLKNSIIYRTDQDGTIEFIINKSDININTYEP